MTPDGEQRPPEPPESEPEYKIYRSRKGLFSRLKGADLSSLRDRARLPSRKPRGERKPRRPGSPRAPFNVRRVLKWIGLAGLAWILISFIAFGMAHLDLHVTPRHPTQLLEPFQKCRIARLIARRVCRYPF